MRKNESGGPVQGNATHIQPVTGNGAGVGAGIHEARGESTSDRLLRENRARRARREAYERRRSGS